MQIMIDTRQCTCRTLNDECYISNKECYEDDVCSSCPLIRNGGVKLPKGHGRLITEPAEEEIAETIGGNNDFAECIRDAVKAVFDNAKTIIPADKESEDKEC